MSEGRGLLDSGKRLLATLVGLLTTRLELLANEWEEERLRLAQLFFFSLFAMFCCATGALLLTALIVVIFWDEHRIATLAIMGMFFLASGAGMVMLVRNRLERGSKLFAASLTELGKDSEFLGGRHE